MKANILITAFKSVRDKSGTTIGLTYALNQIKNGDQRAQIERLRELKGEQYKQAKAQLAVHYFTGQFIGGQGVKNLKSPSGLMILDFDGYPTPEAMQADRAKLQADKHCLAVWISPSGKGLKMLVRIPETVEDSEYKNYFNAIEQHFDNPHFDTNTKDIARACFVSYDPDLFINWDALTWTEQKALSMPPPQQNPAPKPTSLTTNEVFNKLVNERECKALNWTKGNWNTAVYNLACRCNDYNIPQHEAEGLIWNYADKDDGTGYEQALKTIRSAYNQPSANKSYDVPQRQRKVVERAKNSPATVETVSADLFSEKDGIVYSLVSDIQLFYNRLTGKAEYSDGTEMTDNNINTITLQARAQTTKEIGTDAVLRMIFSDYTPSYHPFDDYLRQLADRPLKMGVIDAFLNCLKLTDHHPDYLQRIVKKWFGGLMGTLCGNYSLMTLVFVGKQGNGKTTFFRNLLPDALNKYFVESEVKKDKDIKALMCQNFIVYSDEFTSKNKTEAADYKEMSSAENFTYRKPYGKMNETRKRTACLCGSANEGDILSDPTGNRRVIPVRVKYIDHEALSKINIDDFYRELLELHKADPVWWYLSDDEIAFLNADTVQNEAVDEWAERVVRWTEPDPQGHVSTTDVSRHIAGRDNSYRSNVHKLGRALANIYGASVQKWANDRNTKGYPCRLVNVSEPSQNMPF